MKKRLLKIILLRGYQFPDYIIRLTSFAKEEPRDYMKIHEFLKKKVRKVSRSGKITVTAIGVENIPKEDGFVFVPNHQGLYDVLVFFDTSPRPFSFIIKKESKNIPILKQIIKATDSLVMDREDIRQSMQVIISATKAVQSGRNILIFPEGTRSKRGNETGEFKGGSFRIATKAKAPIVPCALINAYIPLDSSSTEPVDVTLIYLPPMYYEEYKDMHTNDIAIEVKRRIDEAISQYLSDREKC